MVRNRSIKSGRKCGSSSRSGCSEIDNRHKSAGGVELDPFFNTREIDPEWGKNVAIGNLYVGRIARLNVILTGRQRGDREFKIKLVQENGAWKIDEVDSN